MQKLIPYLVAGAVAAGAFSSTGCVARVATGATVTVHDPEPTLAYVSPGVWVVADHHEPVFYHGDSYWLYRNGGWYRSGYYTDGWVRVHAVPVRIRRVHRPRSYVRYRVRSGVRTRRVPARRARPAVRDHRRHRAPPPSRSHRSHKRSRPPARHAPRKGTVHTRDHRSKKKHKAPAKKSKKKKKVNTRDHRRKR